MKSSFGPLRFLNYNQVEEVDNEFIFIFVTSTLEFNTVFFEFHFLVLDVPNF